MSGELRLYKRWGEIEMSFLDYGNFDSHYMLGDTIKLVLYGTSGFVSYIIAAPTTFMAAHVKSKFAYHVISRRTVEDKVTKRRYDTFFEGKEWLSNEKQIILSRQLLTEKTITYEKW
jgi:hypothetical protein